jgi:hypothetical protein
MNFIEQSIENLRNRPKWTVLTNLNSPEDNKWIGMSWEFFDKEEDAERCYERHMKAGNVPTKRPFFTKSDISHLGAAHRRGIAEAVAVAINATAIPEIRKQLADMLMPDEFRYMII